MTARLSGKELLEPGRMASTSGEVPGEPRGVLCDRAAACDCEVVHREAACLEVGLHVGEGAREILEALIEQAGHEGDPIAAGEVLLARCDQL